VTTWTIPVQVTTDAFVEAIELNGTVYTFPFRWNARDDHWFIDIVLNGETLLSGLKLVTISDLLQSSRRIASLPPGRLFVVDLDDLGRDPDADLFGERIVMRYEEA
jgi:hypothetical protein